MIATILAIFALLVALFGLYAFVHIMTSEPAAVATTSVSLMDLKELAGLPADVRKIYQKTVIEIITPALNRIAAKMYADVLKTTTYAELEKESVDAATAFIKQLEAAEQPAREQFINMIDTTRFMRKLAQGQ